MEAGLASRLVQVGIRTLNRHQREQAERFGVEIIEMRDWSPSVVLSFEGPVYVSVDLDALDPAFAPGVSHHEPGGLSTREVIGLLHRMRRARDWRGCGGAESCAGHPWGDGDGRCTAREGAGGPDADAGERVG